MKYIVLKVVSDSFAREIPIIFPDLLVHADVAEMLRGIPELYRADIVSAGQLSCMGLRTECYGGSETLKMKSRGLADDALISMYDYMHGFVDKEAPRTTPSTKKKAKR